ncbi:glycosyltransferase family 2 protein [bacterium SCSIO 12741]|nr:glycosyltransferase family 2 protein [bacterium SCSIO 12741]
MNSSENPFFSVIIPTYNRAHILPETIGYVLNQTFEDWEVVVVDDGSTDETERLSSTWKDARIRYFKTANKERGHARNYGVKQARGQYVFFLDSDDRLTPNHLQVAADFLKGNSFPEILHNRMQMLSEGGAVLRNFPTVGDRAESMLLKINFMGIAVFLRRDVAIEFPFLEDRSVVFGEEWLIWLRLLARYPIHVNDEITYQFVQHDARSVNSMDPDKIVHSAQKVESVLRSDQEFMAKYKDKLPHILATYYLTAANNYLIANQYISGLGSLNKALSLNPKLIASKSFVAALKNTLVPINRSSKNT